MLKTRKIPELTEKDLKRFWSKVNKKDNIDECWEWKGNPINGGYGLILLSKQMYLVHRVSYFINYGEIPENLLVLHKCDNPLCCNPAHYFLGTTTDNMIDRKNKGRGNHPTGDRNGIRKHPEVVQGTNNGNAKLTDEMVIDIRNKYKELDYPQIKEFAKSIGYSNQLVRGIVWNRTWKHLLSKEEKLQDISHIINKYSKFTENDIRDIRNDYKNKILSSTRLAKKYKASTATIFSIIYKRSWQHIA